MSIENQVMMDNYSNFDLLRYLSRRGLIHFRHFLVKVPVLTLLLIPQMLFNIANLRTNKSRPSCDQNPTSFNLDSINTFTSSDSLQ